MHRSEILRVTGTCEEAEREAVAACDELRPAVAGHLRRHVQTGVYCSYEPDPLHPITWQL